MNAPVRQATPTAVLNVGSHHALSNGPALQNGGLSSSTHSIGTVDSTAPTDSAGINRHSAPCTCSRPGGGQRSGANAAMVAVVSLAVVGSCVMLSSCVVRYADDASRARESFAR